MFELLFFLLPFCCVEFVLHCLQVNNTDQPSNGLKRPIAPPSYGGIKDVFRGVYSEGGVRALYRGVGMDTVLQPCYTTST